LEAIRTEENADKKETGHHDRKQLIPNFPKKWTYTLFLERKGGGSLAWEGTASIGKEKA